MLWHARLVLKVKVHKVRMLLQEVERATEDAHSVAKRSKIEPRFMPRERNVHVRVEEIAVHARRILPEPRAQRILRKPHASGVLWKVVLFVLLTRRHVRLVLRVDAIAEISVIRIEALHNLALAPLSNVLTSPARFTR